MSNTVNLTTSMSSCLSALKITEKLMESTNEKLSTGLKVNSALDDPLSYFAAEDHTAEANALSLLNNDMNESIETINAADEGIEAIKDLLDDAKALLNSALTAESLTESDSYQTQYVDLMQDIDELADDSGYAGVNLLAGDSMEVYFNEDQTSGVTVQGTSADSTTLGVNITYTSGAWWDATGSGSPNSTTINTALDNITTAKSTLRSESKTLSSQLSVITTRQEFAEGMINVLETGAADLVNADLNEESANLLALQTRQSLGTNSLSIASQSMQSVLNLF
jgi:flagellin